MHHQVQPCSDTLLNPAERETESSSPHGAGRLLERFTCAVGSFSSAKSSWRHYALAFTAFVVVTLLNFWLEKWIGYQTIALVYLLAIVVLALFVNRGPILFVTALTAACWGYVFAPPRYSFNFADSYDEMTFFTYFAVSLTVGELTARLRAQRNSEQERERRASTLYSLARELAAGTDLADILTRAVRRVREAFEVEVAMLIPYASGHNRLSIHSASTWFPDEQRRGVAAQVFDHNAPLGRGTGTFTDADWLYLPLSVGSGPTGVMGLRFKESGGLSPRQRDLLESFAREIAVVLDRQFLRDTETKVRFLAESERLGRTLLNSVSHELRTPVSAINTAVSTLCASGALTTEQQILASEIQTAGARLNRVVQSLLSAARLQSGHLRPKLDYCDMADILRVALRGVGEFVINRQVEVRIAPKLPLVKADFVLMEQALSNLIINAVIHTPEGTPIEISAHVAEEKMLLEVADRGPGLPPNELERVFESFHRAPAARPGGTGLGLAIVKGFVEAQGGSVRAANRSGGGALFTIQLPVAETPDLPDENS